MSPTLGLLLLVLAGIAGGSVGLPTKFSRQFAWENTWGTFWFFAQVAIPVLCIPLLVPDILGVWSAAGMASIAIPLGFGMLWGVGCITYGAAIHLVGLSLGISVIMGTVLSVGSLLPLATLHPEKIPTRGGCMTLAGIVTALVGSILAGRAAALKERERTQPESPGLARGTRSWIWGLCLAALSGLTSCCLNFGFAFSTRISDLAAEMGTPAWAAGMAIWLLVFLGGFVVCGAFSAAMLTRNRTWSRFREQGAGRDLLWGISMGVLHFAGVGLYGIGAYHIGVLGTSLGFAAFTSVTIIVSNSLGFLTGEWRGAGRRSTRVIVSAIFLLVLSVCLLAVGQAMLSTQMVQTADRKATSL